LFTTTLFVQKDIPRKENFASNPKLHVKEFVLLESDVEEDVQETTNANLVACLNSLLTWLQNVQETKLQNASMDVVLHSTPVFTTEEETVQTNSNHVQLHVEQPRELSNLSKLKLKFHIGLLFKNAKELSKWLKKSLTETSDLHVSTERKELQKSSEELFTTTLKFQSTKDSPSTSTRSTKLKLLETNCSNTERDISEPLSRESKLNKLTLKVFQFHKLINKDTLEKHPKLFLTQLNKNSAEKLQLHTRAELKEKSLTLNVFQSESEKLEKLKELFTFVKDTGLVLKLLLQNLLNSQEPSRRELLMFKF
jgi:hypothetical protein